jgi:hypothetical protein
MTMLTKAVRRLTTATHFCRGTRHIIVTLHPPNGAQGERIGFRLERTRKEYMVDLAGEFESVVYRVCTAEANAIERRAKQIVKGGGIPLRTARRMAREEARA